MGPLCAAGLVILIGTSRKAHMRALNFARIMLWTSCFGSLAVSVAIMAPNQALPTWIPANLLDVVAKTPDWWHAIAGIMTGAGAFFARRQHLLDKKLNKTWYWVAYVGDKD
jgi:hypothetical protein